MRRGTRGALVMRPRKAWRPTAGGVHAASTELRYCMRRIHELDAQRLADSGTKSPELRMAISTLALVVTATLAGCADAPPAPAGRDTYIISTSTTWTFKAGGELLPSLYAKADAFCGKQGKVSTPVSNTTGDG